MEENITSVLTVIRALREKWKPIVCIIITTTIISIIYTFFILTPTYKSEVKVFIGKDKEINSEYSSGDLDLYKNLIKTYSELLFTDDLLQKAIDNNNLNVDLSILKSGLIVSKSDDTQIMTISYVSTNNFKAKEVLDAVTNQFILDTKNLIPNGKAKIIQNSKFPIRPNNMNNLNNIVIGVLGGIVLGCGIYLFLELFSDTLKNKYQIESLTGVSVIGVIPNENI